MLDRTTLQNRLALRYGLSRRMSLYLSMLITAEFVSNNVAFTAGITDTKELVYRLRQKLAQCEGPLIYSQRELGYWIDYGTRTAILEELTPSKEEPHGTSPSVQAGIPRDAV